MRYHCLILILLLPLFTVQADSEDPSRDLVLETLAQDIDTAGYYELLAWCRELGLDDSGGRKELQDRLLVRFKIESAEAEKEAEEERWRLEIKSARDTEYFTIQEAGEDYIMLQGDVLVELMEQDAVHRIRAERIVLNQATDMITAEGDIEYRLTRGEEEQLFRGEKLTFNIETWEGVFFRGGMESETEIEGENIRFIFSGSTITKLKNDTIVLDEGIITSSKPRGPYYHIRAKKIWVLAPGEWAIWNAVLFVGRIPVLYIPFFFLPGDAFFFHPVLGYREREGSFLQTTTYLIGRKQRKKSPISILAATEDTSTQYKREIRGLFLRQTDEEYIPPEQEDWFLKVLLDGYSKLGGFIGLAGDFSPYFSFQGGLGFSRSLFAVGESYTPFWPDEEQKYKSYWNRSWLFGAELPFRYGLDADWKIGSGDYQLAGLFEFYSDPYFTQDFYNRAEDINWANILGLDEETGEQIIPSEKWNLSWELTGKADFSDLTSIPQLNTLAIPYFNAKLYWQSKYDASITANPELADPTRRFYYPASLKLPSTSLQIGGEILNLRAGDGKDEEDSAGLEELGPEEDPGKGYRSPLAQEEETLEAAGEVVEPEEFTPFRLPAPKEDLPARVEREPATFQLSYQIRPNIIVEQSYDSEDWKKQSEVDFTAAYTALETSGFSSLDYNLKVLNELLGLSGSLLYSGTYRTRYRQAFSGTQGEWENLVFNDYRQTKSDFKTSFKASLFPFLEAESFEKSNISYNLNWTFYQILLEEPYTYGNPIYYGLGPEFDRDTVKEHLVQAAFLYQPYQRQHSLTLSAQLPPLLGRLTGKLEFYVWLLKTTVQSVYKETDEVWRFDPLILRETLEITEEVNFSEELRFDLETSLLLKSISSLSFWGFSSSFTAERMNPFTFDPTPNTGGWKETGEKAFLPSYVKVGYQLLQHPFYFWKNRIRFEVALNTSWSMNLQQFTENSLDFSLSLNLFIYKFLEFSFTTTAYNDQTHRYFPGLLSKLPPELEQTWINPLEDLLGSFNFFNVKERERSSFKLKGISIAAVHHLHDWDLTFSYQGKPKLVTDPAGKLEYEWDSTFSIFLQWIPIPEMRSHIRGDESGFYLRG